MPAGKIGSVRACGWGRPLAWPASGKAPDEAGWGGRLQQRPTVGEASRAAQAADEKYLFRAMKASGGDVRPLSRAATPRRPQVDAATLFGLRSCPQTAGQILLFCRRCRLISNWKCSWSSITLLDQLFSQLCFLSNHAHCWV